MLRRPRPSRASRSPARTRPRTWPSSPWARRPTTPTGRRVKFAVTLFLPPDLAEYLIARAIREGKNTAGLIGEILAAERGRT